MLATRICNIPCLIDIDYYHVQKPNPYNDASDWDCNGYTDINFTVYDRKGYKAPWLTNKLTAKELDRIHDEVVCYMREEEESYYD